MPTERTRLDAIRQREQAATEGPWVALTIGYADHEGQLDDIRDALEYADRDGVVMTDMTWVESEHRHVALTGNGPRQTHNAAFIAHARTDLPLLLRVADAASWVIRTNDEAQWSDMEAAWETLRAALAPLLEPEG